MSEIVATLERLGRERREVEAQRMALMALTLTALKTARDEGHEITALARAATGPRSTRCSKTRPKPSSARGVADLRLGAAQGRSGRDDTRERGLRQAEAGRPSLGIGWRGPFLLNHHVPPLGESPQRRRETASSGKPTAARGTSRPLHHPESR